MRTVAILGSRDLAATLARRLAEAERARRVVLVDEDVGRARGKALDIAQSGPVEAFDVRVEGAADVGAAGAADALVVADPAELPEGSVRPSGALVDRLRAASAGVVIVASAHPCALVEALIDAGHPAERVDRQRAGRPGRGAAPAAGRGAGQALGSFIHWSGRRW